jgi:hypothetical protein
MKQGRVANQQPAQRCFKLATCSKYRSSIQVPSLSQKRGQQNEMQEVSHKRLCLTAEQKCIYNIQHESEAARSCALFSVLEFDTKLDCPGSSELYGDTRGPLIGAVVIRG